MRREVEKLAPRRIPNTRWGEESKGPERKGKERKLRHVLNCSGSRWTNSQANTFCNLINSSLMSIPRISHLAPWVIVLYI